MSTFLLIYNYLWYNIKKDVYYEKNIIFVINDLFLYLVPFNPSVNETVIAEETTEEAIGHSQPTYSMNSVDKSYLCLEV